MTAPAPLTYAEALAAAAALRAATTAPGPLDAIASTVMAAARATQKTVDTTVAAILRLWNRTNPYDDTAVARFAAAASEELIPAQQLVARRTAATQTQILRSVGVPITVTPRVPDDVRLSTPQGRVRPQRATVDYNGQTRTVDPESARTSRVMVRVAENYRYTRASGASHVQADTAARNRVSVIVDGNLQVVQSIVEHQALAATQTVDLDRPVVGYRRIIHPELSAGGVCGMCVAAADRKYKISTLKAIHGRCKCTVAPIFDDFDPGGELNGRDLDALYAAAGGNSRRQLQRTRYRVVEHSELGPMLLPEHGEAVPYLPALTPA
ncbi:hypothetical protein [Nocardia sp. NPDC019302]|uniref:hypothetical protein n=1 Tax=Nocardia sp. NPDC019302 TaxID=3154592 RepID=UPI0033F810FC